MAYTGRVNLPDNTERIGLEVRMIDGVPTIFTDRGEHVKGQRRCVVSTAFDSVVSVTLEFMPTRVEPKKP
jgi:hypothetical protein